MGIDIFPTDESLQHCEHALCSSDLRRILVLFPPEEIEQELAGLISQEGDIKGIYLERLTGDQKRRLERYDRSDWDYDDAWHVRSFEEQMTICKRCPVPPPGYNDCNVRLSGYSAMNDFRIGLEATVHYSKALTKDEWRDWVDPSDLGGKSPSEKLQDLFERSLAKATTELPRPERFFGRALKQLEEEGYKVLWGQAPSSSNEPIVEGFLNTYVYRIEPYSPQEAAELLSCLRILEGLAKKMENELTERGEQGQLRSSIRTFRLILANFTAALGMAVKFNLQLEISS
jgi:hypothetical protein